MKTNNPVEIELNAIRVDFYEKTKGMSLNEKIAYIKAQTTFIHEKHGIYTTTKTQIDVSGRASQ